MPKIQAENLGGKFLRKILAENLGGKFLRKILADNLGASQNLGVYTEFMRLVKIQAYDRTISAVEISAPGKISAPSQNLSGKVWRPLTIWARQKLPLLTSSWSG
jgi:hypothetical protein